uniref:Uncharacterized protein n=1 Tax=Peronospora matthiolae TaxID=2874970 RepID=A0AAV1VLE2_9STRA
MMNEHGLPRPTPEHMTVVAEFATLVDAALPLCLRWEHNTCSLDISSLLGANLARFRKFLRATYEPMVEQGLPLLELRFFLLLDESGNPLPDSDKWIQELSSGPVSN